jgi:hypothetical protein
MTGRLLETPWFLLWLFAIVIVGRWAWRLLGNEPVYEPAANWRNLYRQALVERDETKVAIRIQEAEGAILVELATQVFGRNSRQRIALQDAMNNLYALRQTHSLGSEQSRVPA